MAKAKVIFNDAVPNLTDALKDAITELTVNARQSELDDIRVSRPLARLGFKPRKSRDGIGTGGEFWLNDRLKLVVKFDPYLYGDKPKRSVPTWGVNIIKYDTTVLVQPFVDTKSAKARSEIRAHDRARAAAKNHLEGFNIEAHDCNVGLYNGELLQFDW